MSGRNVPSVEEQAKTRGTQSAFGQEGLTLREYLAGQALQGLLAGGARMPAPHGSVEELARQHADALLVELLKSQG